MVVHSNYTITKHENQYGPRALGTEVKIEQVPRGDGVLLAVGI